jgi:hypothetical protein
MSTNPPQQAGTLSSSSVADLTQSTLRLDDYESPRDFDHYETTSSHQNLRSVIKEASSITYDADNSTSNEPTTRQTLYANERDVVVARSIAANESILSYDSFKSALDSRLNGYLNQEGENENGETLEGKINLPKCLLYKKASNGKYIRFETVVKNKLYDTQTGKIKGLKFL